MTGSYHSQTLATHTGQKTDRLNDDAWERRESDRLASQELAAKAQQLAEKTGYTLGQAHSLIPPAFIAFREGRYSEALENGFYALSILKSEAPSVWLTRLYNILGLVHAELGERAEASAYFEEQREISQSLNDDEMEALAQHDFALYNLEGEPQIEMLERALATFEAVKSSGYRVIALCNIGECYLIKGVPESALRYMKQVITLSFDIGYTDIQIMALGIQAKCYSALDDTPNAFSSVEEALDIAQNRAPHMLYYCEQMLGTLYQASARHAEALEAFKRSIVLNNQFAHYKLEGYRLLAECYAATGNYAQAYEQQKNFQILHDEVFREESQHKVRALEVIYRTRSAQRDAELERSRNAELLSHIAQLEALNAQVRELSIRDSLTNLYNRRYFGEKLAEHFASVSAGGPSLGLILLDIDHFKNINDAFGHAVGDVVLRGVATLLMAQVRDSDIVTRYGGEEFAILLPQHELARTLKIAERIRSLVEAQHWAPQEALGRQTVTLSLGVAMSTSCRDTDELLRQADARLYEAKRLGRNRVYSGALAYKPQRTNRDRAI